MTVPAAIGPSPRGPDGTASWLDAAVNREGEGPLPPELVGSDAPPRNLLLS
jgi:hypothetical protein